MYSAGQYLKLKDVAGDLCIIWSHPVLYRCYNGTQVNSQGYNKFVTDLIVTGSRLVHDTPLAVRKYASLHYWGSCGNALVVKKPIMLFKLRFPY